jgi:hypothetical protein
VLGGATIGLADSQRVNDAVDDGSSGCEITRATAGHRRSKLVHTVTVADPTTKENAPIVFLNDEGGNASPPGNSILSPGEPGVGAKLKNGGRTIAYTVTAKTLRSEAEVPRGKSSYFWMSTVCFGAGSDWAPDGGDGSGVWKKHSLKR